MVKRSWSTPKGPSKKAKSYGGYKSYNKRIPGNINGGRRSIMPDSLDINLPYVDNIAITAPSGGQAAVHVFSLNGMYDPDITGVGHQPRGFDQWCGTENSQGMYHHYLVKGAKVEITFCNYGNDPVRVGATFKDRQTISTNPADYVESADAEYVICGKEGSGQEIRKITLYWSGRKWFGKPNLDTERDLMGSPTSNPIEQAYLHVFCGNMIGLSDTSVRFDIKISYACGFKSPTTPAMS